MLPDHANHPVVSHAPFDLACFIYEEHVITIFHGYNHPYGGDYSL